MPRRARVAEDVEDHLCRAAVGHPVFGIHQQRIAQRTENPLHGFDQLDPEDRRRRDDHRRRMVDQRLLQFAQRFPVEQAGRFAQVAFAAPAAGAGVQHQQRRVAGQLILPTLEAQQLADQFILGGALLGKALALLDQRRAGIRVVAPALAQQVAEQRVADDAPRERVAIGGLFPLRREVPVIGDVVGVII